MTAILFGSMSSLADTSELQRKAFNAAFEQHGLDWTWSQEEYQPMLLSSGGQKRVAEYAAERGQEVDAAAVHQTKSALAQEQIRTGVTARPGVVETIRAAKDAGAKVGLVTTTDRANLTAIFDGLEDISEDDFDVITDSSTDDDKQAAYAHALERLGAEAGDAVAIEDNPLGVGFAKAAGVRAVAFPNENTAVHDFGAADERVDRLDPSALVASA